MANSGVFDAEIRMIAWFDPTAIQEGWWDYGMPFEHDLMTDTVTTTWPGWIQSEGGWF